MSTPATEPVIYEVECSLDPSVVEAFDAWLPGHVRDVLACPGFIGAEIQTVVESADRPVRRCQYRVESAAALQRYLDQDAPRLRADSAARFGDQATFTRRVLASRPVPPPPPPVICHNCGAVVSGHYCADCGQSRDIHVLSMHEVLGDITHSLLHLDSRAWRTLRSLALKPGQLTREFIAGRHQRYLPPFRLYLVLSVAFFALSALLPGRESPRVDGNQVIAPVQIGPRISSDEPGPAATPAGPATGPSDECNVSIGLPGLRRFEPLLSKACRKVREDGGHRLGEVFLHTAPKLMFVFLPLMAAVAMLFYWRPRRLYAEHLVMFLHVHAFVFLWLSVNATLDAVGVVAPSVAGPLGVLGLLLALYVPWYVFRAMRVVYGQGRALTAAKFVVLSTLYFMLLGITMAAGIVYSLLSL